MEAEEEDASKTEVEEAEEEEVMGTTSVAEAVCTHQHNNNITTKAVAEVNIITIAVVIEAMTEGPLATAQTHIQQIKATSTAMPRDSTTTTTTGVVINGDWRPPQFNATITMHMLKRMMTVYWSWTEFLMTHLDTSLRSIGLMVLQLTNSHQITQ